MRKNIGPQLEMPNVFLNAAKKVLPSPTPCGGKERSVEPGCSVEVNFPEPRSVIQVRAVSADTKLDYCLVAAPAGGAFCPCLADRSERCYLVQEGQ